MQITNNIPLMCVKIVLFVLFLQHLPTAMHGAVLAFGARAPSNGGAISVSFGSTGYASALARVFRWVRF